MSNIRSRFQVAVPAPVVSRFVVVSPLGTRFTGRWPTRESAFEFSASLQGGYWPEIDARIQECPPYTA